MAPYTALLLACNPSMQKGIPLLMSGWCSAELNDSNWTQVVGWRLASLTTTGLCLLLREIIKSVFYQKLQL